MIVVLPRGLFGSLRDVLGATARAKLSEPSAITLETAGRTAPVSSAQDVVVEVAGLSKSFGSLSVLSDVSFSARRGELVSLVGPNGAGKTTLIRCLADGGERSDGSVKIMGRSIHRLPPQRIVALGLGRKFQAASVFETLSVADCLRVARTRHERPSLLFASNTLALPTAARAVLETSGLAERLHEEARFLSHGLKQALELAMVLALEPEVVLLDEPTAGLTRAERQRFAELLTALASVDRLCVLIVEHDLDFVREISSRIIVLHQGRIALDGTVEEVVEFPAGAGNLQRTPFQSGRGGKPMNAMLEVANVSSGYGSSMVVRGASLQIAPGEIVAVVGKNGMGKTSLLKTILGFLPARSGTVLLDGRDVTRLSSHLKRRLALRMGRQPRDIPATSSTVPLLAEKYENSLEQRGLAHAVLADNRDDVPARSEATPRVACCRSRSTRLQLPTWRSSLSPAALERCPRRFRRAGGESTTSSTVPSSAIRPSMEDDDAR